MSEIASAVLEVMNDHNRIDRRLCLASDGTLYLSDHQSGVEIAPCWGDATEEDAAEFVEQAKRNLEPVLVRVDVENNAETWWEVLHAKHREFARQLASDGEATVTRAFLAQIESLPGYRTGPAHARTALVVSNS